LVLNQIYLINYMICFSFFSIENISKIFYNFFV